MQSFSYNPIQIENAASNDVTIRIQGYIGLPEWADEWMDEAQINNTKDKMRRELESIQNIKAKRITVEIDSFGGAIDHALAIYDALRSTGSTITTKYIGWSASAATVIGMAGEKRIGSENMYLLIHQVRGFAYGTAETIKNTAEFYADLNNRLADIYSKAGNIEKSKIVDLMAIENGEGKWLNAQDAKEYGLLTEIAQDYRAAAYAKNIIESHKLPTNNLNFEHKMENSLKSKIAELLGITNDTELANINSELTARIETLEAAVNGHEAAVIEVTEPLNAQIASLTDERNTAIDNATQLQETVTNQATEISNHLATIESLKNQLKNGAINLETEGDPDFKGQENPEFVATKEALLNRKKGIA